MNNTKKFKTIVQIIFRILLMKFEVLEKIHGGAFLFFQSITMKYCCLIFTIAFCSCHKPPQNLYNQTPVLVGVLEAQKPITNIRFFFLNEQNSEEVNIETNNLKIRNESATIDLHWNENGQYSANENVMVDANKTYSVEVALDSEKVFAQCHIPPAIHSIPDVVSDTITINPDPAVSAFTYAWTELDNEKYSYLIKLENMELNPVEIPFVNGPGDFAQFDGPYEYAQLQFLETDFRHYGHHQFKVFAIEKTFEELFFYDGADSRGLLKNGPDNVDGARGYFAGVSSFTVDVFVQ